MRDQPKEVAHSFVAAINSGDANAVRNLMTEDHTFVDALGNTFSGADQIKSGWLHFFRAYADYRISVRHTFVEGSLVALFGEATGRWRVADRVLTETWKVAAAWLAVVEAEKIRQWSVFCDTSWVKPPQ
jgi:ketosteroid isomerase-like protein